MMEMRIIPYVFLEDHWSIPNEGMLSIWDMMVKDDLHKTIFYTGTVLDYENFLKRMQDHRNCVITQWIGDKPVFIGWLNGFNKISVSCHFCCFKNIWGKRTDEAMRAAFKFWFDMTGPGGNLFDTISGMIPDFNKQAIRFVKRCGVNIVGSVPNHSINFFTGDKVGATILYITREGFQNG